jgi:16S rRNA (guanine527-N7)-methyltransferase
MAIMRPESKVTLIEANGKKITFLQELIAKLQLENVKTVQGRSEDLARGELREAFEVVTARAVAALPALAEYCLPFVKEGGIFIALKGGSEKYEDGAAAVEELGGDLEDFAEYTLPGGDLRRIFIIEKISKTPKKYPRSNALIKKTPLR